MNQPRVIQKKIYKEAKNHFLDSIPDDLHDIYGNTELSGNPFSDIDKIFTDESGVITIINIGRKRAFINWMQGLPTALDIEFSTYGIETAVHAWFDAINYLEGFDRIEEKERYYYEQLANVFLTELDVLNFNEVVHSSLNSKGGNMNYDD